MDIFERSIRFLGSLVWGPQMVILLLGVGLFLTIRLRFAQLRRLGLSLRLLLGQKDFGESKKERRGDITPLQALTTSLAAVIGNGNIANESMKKSKSIHASSDYKKKFSGGIS